MAAQENELDVEQAAIRPFFVEAEEFNSILKQIVETDPITTRLYERAIAILEKYQEFPQLLNPYLEGITSPLLNAVTPLLLDPKKSEDSSTYVSNFNQDQPDIKYSRVDRYMRLLYVLSKVRGYKSISTYFPHEVQLVEPVFHYLIYREQRGGVPWETEYVLFLWLGALVLNPFDLASMDSSSTTVAASGSEISESSLIWRMYKLGQLFLGSCSKGRESSAFFLSKLLTRPDTKSNVLIKFIHWSSMEVLCHLPSPSNSSSASEYFLQCGALLTLARILKVGTRADLLPHGNVILKSVLNLYTELTQSSDTPTAMQKQSSMMYCKLLLKVAQRVVLIYFPHRTATWRYQRGNRSLVANLTSQYGKQCAQGVGISSMANNTDSTDASRETETEDCAIPPLVEETTGALLDGLKQADTIVRWTSAKGLGRICQRLPNRRNADDVVSAVLSSCFELYEDSNAWHGGCICLAELARRGLLMPYQLVHVVPVTIQALEYTLQKGNYAIGAHVRDAACYVCWAFARAFQPADVAEYVTNIAQQLIITAVFDREVNVRRAAAAAFQECVGRLSVTTLIPSSSSSSGSGGSGSSTSSIPHGIEIIQIAEYFSLASRGGSFLKVAPQLARFNAYRRPMVRHLLEQKIMCWDQEVRELSSQALALLLREDAGHAKAEVLPFLLHASTDASSSTELRHGALLSLAEIIRHVFTRKDEGSSGSLPSSSEEEDEQLWEQLRQVVPRIEAERLYRGRGGEKIRIAVCHLLRCFSDAKVPLPRYSTYSKTITVTARPSSIPGRGRGGGAKNVTHTTTELTLVRYQLSLEENITQTNPKIQQSAVVAFRAFADAYYRQFEAEVHTAMVRRLAAGLTPTATTPVNIRRGVGMACGVLPPPVLQNEEAFETLTSALLGAVPVESDADARDAESRAAALRGLSGVCCNGIARLNAENVPRLFEAFLLALRDYAVDRRGDVGSFVRMAAMECFPTLLPVLASAGLLTCALWVAFLQGVAKQALEKIDRVRGVAGSVLARVVFDSRLPDTLPHKAMIRDAIAAYSQKLAQATPAAGGAGGGAAVSPTKEKVTLMEVDTCGETLSGEPESPQVDVASECGSEAMESSTPTTTLTAPHRQGNTTTTLLSGVCLDWTSPSVTYPLLVPLFFREACLVRPAVEGVLVAVGGLTVHVMREASAALVSFLKQQQPQQQQEFSELLLRVYEEALFQDRVVLPLLNAVEQLLIHQVFHASSALPLLQLVRREFNETAKKDPHKMMAYVRVVCGLLSIPPAALLQHAAGATAVESARAAQCPFVQFVLAMLHTRLAKVRSTAAQQLYTTLLTFESHFVFTPNTTAATATATVSSGGGLLPSPAALSEACDLLLHTRWDGTTDSDGMVGSTVGGSGKCTPEVNSAWARLHELFGLPLPKAASLTPQASNSNAALKDTVAPNVNAVAGVGVAPLKDGYTSLVKDEGY